MDHKRTTWSIKLKEDWAPEGSEEQGSVLFTSRHLHEKLLFQAIVILRSRSLIAEPIIPTFLTFEIPSKERKEISDEVWAE